jgi:hypothetical protein
MLFPTVGWPGSMGFSGILLFGNQSAAVGTMVEKG